MPGRDGTGPAGRGPVGGNRGLGAGRYGRAGAGAGPGGLCVCPQCGATAPHQAAVPCGSVNCPKCGAKMTRG